MILPENETLPITKPAIINDKAPVLPRLCSNSVNPIKAAQAPPIPLNIETNSGILVICTRLAVSQPINVPISKDANRIPILSPSLVVCSVLYKNKVAATAMAIPTAPSILPFRADFGLPIIFKPMIKVIEPIK